MISSWDDFILAWDDFILVWDDFILVCLATMDGHCSFELSVKGGTADRRRVATALRSRATTRAPLSSPSERGAGRRLEVKGCVGARKRLGGPLHRRNLTRRRLIFYFLLIS